MSNEHTGNDQEESRAERRERMITAARNMLSMGYTTGDIKRHFRKHFGIGYRQVHRYIRHARDRNLEHLNKTAEQHLSDSVEDWRKMREEAEETIRRCRRQLMEAESVQRQQTAVLADPDASDEDRGAATELLVECRKMVTALGQQMASARITIQATRRETDRLLGNHAPMKVAQTTTDGRDVAKAVDTPPEPSDPVKELDEMAERFRARAGLAGDGSGGSGNGQKLHTEN